MNETVTWNGVLSDKEATRITNSIIKDLKHTISDPFLKDIVKGIGLVSTLTNYSENLTEYKITEPYCDGQLFLLQMSTITPAIKKSIIKLITFVNNKMEKTFKKSEIPYYKLDDVSNSPTKNDSICYICKNRIIFAGESVEECKCYYMENVTGNDMVECEDFEKGSYRELVHPIYFD